MISTEQQAVTVAQLQKLQDWLREPDHAENFGTQQILEWINRRPTHIIPSTLGKLALSRLASVSSASAEGAVSYQERVEYETRVLSAEMEVERARKVLRLFSDKADKWEANHPRNTSGMWPDSSQVQHRLGDFRAARALSHRFDRLAEGLVEIPFAWCCAEGGGSVSGCGCVKKDHGTAWSHPQDIRNANRYVAKEVQS